MARLFIRLKIRLLRNGLRAGWSRRVGMIMGAVVALPLALSGFVALAAAGRTTDAEPVAVLACTSLFVAWVTIPVLGFGTDETLDPSRLELFPLTRRQLIVGLLAASMVGVAPLATSLGAAGAVIGYGRLSGGLPLVVAAAAVEVAMCVTGARAVVTALARLLRSRRGRDLVVVAAAFVALAPQLLRLALEPRPGRDPSEFAVDLHPMARIARWSPPGMAGQAMADAAHSHLLPALGELAGAAAFVVVLLWWWSRSLERAMTSAEATGTAPSKRGPNRRGAPVDVHPGDPLVPGLLRWLPAGRTAAVAAKELRYASREPRRRVQILMGLLVPMIAMLPALARGGFGNPKVVLVSVFVAFMFAGTTSLNAFGLDGPPFWVHVAAGNDPRADLVGKNVGAALLGLPLTAAVALLLAVPSGGWRYVPLVLALSIGIMGVGLGVGDVASVRAPQPVTPTTTNPWATNTGQGCATGLLAMAAFLGEVVLLVPVAVLVGAGFAGWKPGLFLAAPVAVAYGGVVWWLGVRYASDWVWWRLPELLAAVSPP